MTVAQAGRTHGGNSASGWEPILDLCLHLRLLFVPCQTERVDTAPHDCVNSSNALWGCISLSSWSVQA